MTNGCVGGRHSLPYPPAGGPRARAYPPAAVTKADHPTERHDHAADPDPRNQRLPIDPNGPVALLVGITERDIEVGEQIRPDRRLAGGLLLQREEPALGVHDGDRLAAARHPDRGIVGYIVRTGDTGDAVERQFVAGDLDRAPRLEDFNRLPRIGGGGETGNRDRL
jgi:hypothetical protein